MAKTETAQVINTIAPEAVALIQKATLEAMKQVQAPENKNPPPAYWNGYGLPDFPKLAWEKVLFCGAPIEARDCKKEEVQLLNQVQPKEGVYGPDKNIHVAYRSSHGKPVQLHIWVSGVKSIEGRMGQPTLVQTLRYIIDEQSTVAA